MRVYTKSAVCMRGVRQGVRVRCVGGGGWEAGMEGRRKEKRRGEEGRGQPRRVSQDFVGEGRERGGPGRREGVSEPRWRRVIGRVRRWRSERVCRERPMPRLLLCLLVGV